VHIAAFTGSRLCTEVVVFVRQRHQLVLSQLVLDEFERGLIKKLKQSPSVAGMYRRQLELRCLVQPEPKHAPKRSRDPKDDPILQAALDADCDWLISGDADLTSLKRVQGMPISTPRDFLEALGVEESFE
jgi:predicted nucleic acid-binding protein